MKRLLRLIWPRKPEPRPGAAGEDAAARHLRGNGCKILARNLRIGGCELDIVARDGDTILFVEVRSRASEEPIPPEDTVGPAKQRQIKRAADAWIRRHGRREYYYRFDIIAVTFNSRGQPLTRHLPDAFR